MSPTKSFKSCPSSPGSSLAPPDRLSSTVKRSQIAWKSVAFLSFPLYVLLNFFVSDSGRQFPGAGLELLRRNQRSELGSFHYRVAKSWFDLWHSWKQPSNAAALKYSNFSEPCFICAFITSAVFLCSHKNHSVIKSHHSSRLPGLGRLQGKGAVILCQGARHRVQIRYSLENEPQRLLLSFSEKLLQGSSGSFVAAIQPLSPPPHSQRFLLSWNIPSKAYLAPELCLCKSSWSGMRYKSYTLDSIWKVRSSFSLNHEYSAVSILLK